MDRYSSTTHIEYCVLISNLIICPAKINYPVSPLLSTHPIDVVRPVHLLVLEMSAIITGAKRQQHHIFTGRLLKGQGIRNTSSFSC